MRSISLSLGALPLVAGLMLGATSAFAGDPHYGERYHADSFGNLIVYSPAGYKRIIVGQGNVLAQLDDRSDVAEPRVYSYDGATEGRSYRRCYTVPGMFKGRSYMYGLPDGVVPSPARRVCR
jgi:hypothetical protein